VRFGLGRIFAGPSGRSASGHFAADYRTPVLCKSGARVSALLKNRPHGALPLEPFRYYQYGERTVYLDGCVEVDAAYYSTPPGWVGRRVRGQWDGVRLRILAPETELLLREHLRQERGRHRIADDDKPRRTPATTQALLRRAHAAGRHIGGLCIEIHRSDGEPGVRKVLGILALAKKHGAPVVDEAAKTAMELGAPTYPLVRRYLERRPPAPLTLKQVDPLIRQLSLYRDLIQRRTGE
jgi:hypothetical protein